MPYGMAAVCEDTAIEVAAIKEAEAEAEEFLHYTRESVNPFGSNNLIQLPVRFMQQGNDHEEGPALLDCGATHSFVSMDRVKQHGWQVTARQATVKNGDGTTQLQPGTVTVPIAIGPRFKVRVTLRVVQLDKFDVIVGMDLIQQYRIKWDWDPFRITAVTPSTSTKSSSRVQLPVCFLARRDAQGRDISSYHCDRFCLEATLREHEAMKTEVSDMLMVDFSDGAALSYPMLVKELFDFANTSSSAEEFMIFSKDLLAGLEKQPKPRHDGSAGEAQAADVAAKFTAPSQHAHAEKERQFREQIIQDYPDLCSDSLPLDGPSATLPDGTPYKVRLQLKEGREPRSRKPFRIPEAYREELRKTIDDLVKYKLIEPSVSPFVNPVFLVPKPPRPDGSYAGLRFVFDGRQINQAIEPDSHFIPRVEELIDRVARLKYEAEKAGETNLIISCLDQRTSFWQLALEEDSRPLTAFSTSEGTWQWRCLPMGLLVSSAHLQRFTEALLRPFSISNTFEFKNSSGKLVKAFGTAMGYIDDLCVVTFGSVEVHEVLLRRILAAMEKCRLRLQPAKCEFFRLQGHFLGHVISSDGISQQANKLQAILNWPMLTDLKSVRSFVSLCSYYRKFVKDFAQIARPLTDLLRADGWKKPFPPEVLEAFEQLKVALTTAPVLKFFDVHAESTLSVDASGYSIGAVLHQTDGDGIVRPVGFYSRRLTDAEMKYSTYDRELVGLRDGVLHFRHWLLGIPFKVKTDHCSLRWLLSQPELTGQRQRWLTVLQEFRITEIIHVAGVVNVVADVLSRYPDPQGQSYDHLIPEHGNMDVRFSNLEEIVNHWHSVDASDGDAVHGTADTGSIYMDLRAMTTQTARRRRDSQEFKRMLREADGDIERLRQAASSARSLPDEQLTIPSVEYGEATTQQSYLPLPMSSCSSCNFCGSSTCDTIKMEFQRHGVQPIAIADMEADGKLEKGFPEASMVSAMPDAQDFEKDYLTCNDFAKIFTALTEWKKDSEHPQYPEYYLNPDGLLIFKDNHKHRLCVPTGKRELLLRVMHDNPLGSHFSASKTQALMAANFYFPKMATRIERYCESCDACQRNKAYNANTRGVPQPHPVPRRRFDAVALDILCGFPETKAGHTSVVVFTDRLTKRAWIEPCNDNVSARDVALLFFRSVFRSQGMPRILLSDNGPQFSSTFWQEFFGLLKTDIRLTSSYHPQSNGGSERFNRTLLEALRSYVSTRQRDWDEYLIHFEFAYNNSLNPSTGFSPFVLTYAQSPRAPWAALDQSILDGMDNVAARNLGLDIVSNVQQARDALHAQAQAFRERHAQQCKPHNYSVGDEVLLSTENVKLRVPCNKLGPRFVGPFRILDLLGRNAVRIKPTGIYKALHDKINIEHLRPYHRRAPGVGRSAASAHRPPLLTEASGREWYEVEEIMAHRGQAGPKQSCLVRFKGFDDSHDQWLPRTQINDAALIAYEQFLRDDVFSSKCDATMEHFRSFVGAREEFSVIRQVARAAKSAATRAAKKATEDASSRPPVATSSSVSFPSSTTRAGRVSLKTTRFKPPR